LTMPRGFRLCPFSKIVIGELLRVPPDFSAGLFSHSLPSHIHSLCSFLWKVGARDQFLWPAVPFFTFLFPFGQRPEKFILPPPLFLCRFRPFVPFSRHPSPGPCSRKAIPSAFPLYDDFYLQNSFFNSLQFFFSLPSRIPSRRMPIGHSSL